MEPFHGTFWNLGCFLSLYKVVTDDFYGTFYGTFYVRCPLLSEIGQVLVVKMGEKNTMVMEPYGTF